MKFGKIKLMNNKKIQNGTLIYDFKNTNTPQKTVNLGDYVQSIAAMNLVGTTENDSGIAFVDREDLKSTPFGHENGKLVKFVANGWYTHNQKSFPTNENIMPLFTSVHIDDRLLFSEDVISTFKMYEPIGCRDITSTRKLSEHGIKSYFSGCLTLTFDPVDIERNGIVFVVDNLFDSEGKIITSLKQFRNWRGYKKVEEVLLKEYTMSDIENSTFLTQLSSINLSPKEQFEKARKNLDILSKADLVITTRIHTLMPSMSLGSRAIILITNLNDDRFKGLINFWNYIDFTVRDEINLPVESINYDENGKIINNSEFRDFMKPEISKIKEWWSKKFW